MSSTSDWNINELYKKAWQLTWNNKKLWILGLAYALIMAATSQLNSNINLPSSPDTDTQETLTAPEASPAAALTTFQENFEPFFEAQQRLLEVVDSQAFAPSSTSVILVGIGGTIFMLLTWASWMFARFWIMGATISGVHLADTKQLDISKASNNGIQKWTQLFWLRFKTWAIYYAIVLLVILTYGIFFWLTSLLFEGVIYTLVTIALGVSIVPMLFLGIKFWITTTAKIIWAERLLCIEDASVNKALTTAQTFVENNLLHMVGLAIANYIVRIIVGLLVGLPFMLAAGLIGWNLYTNFSLETIGSTILYGGISLTVITFFIGPVGNIGQAILNIFMHAVWYYAYLEVTSDKKS